MYVASLAGLLLLYPPERESAKDGIPAPVGGAAAVYEVSEGMATPEEGPAGVKFGSMVGA